MRDPVGSIYRAIGLVSIFAFVLVLMAMGFHLGARGNNSSGSSDTKDVSFEGATEVGEIEGRKVYRFQLEDGTRCLSVSGHNGSGLDCDWVSEADGFTVE